MARLKLELAAQLFNDYTTRTSPHFTKVGMLVSKKKLRQREKKEAKVKEDEVFYSISNLVGYLMPNPLHTYKLNRHDL